MISLKGRTGEAKDSKQKLINLLNQEIEMTTSESGKIYDLVNGMSDSDIENHLSSASRYGIRTVYYELKNLL